MRLKLSLFFLLLLSGASYSLIALQGTQTLHGTIEVLDEPLSCAEVRLFEARSADDKFLGSSTANCKGEYHINFRAQKGSLLYLLAWDPDRTEIVLAAAFELGDAQDNRIVVNELTTVATAYALAQFIEQDKICGPLPGLKNAVATIENLVCLSTGKPGSVISNRQNGAQGNNRSTDALRTQNTLANLISGCARDPEKCECLFSLISTHENSIESTLQLIHSIAKNPFTQDNTKLYGLSQVEEIFTPSLEEAPKSWTLALHFICGGFSAPGRVAFDSVGNLWSNNNYMPPAGNLRNKPGRQITVLNPSGKPILGSPIFSRFVKGSGYGVAIDQKDHTWIASFNNNKIAQFTPEGKIALHSRGLNHPMGMAVDQKGNLWIANMGDPSDKDDSGSITVFIGGNPEERITQKEGIKKPFSVAIDNSERCWVANSTFLPGGSVTILELNDNNEIEIFKKEITSKALGAPKEPGSFHAFGDFASPKTIAIDQHGNGWINNFEAPAVSFIDGVTFDVMDYPVDPQSRGWGLAVDGRNRIWSASFTNPPPGPLSHEPPVISVLEGLGKDRGFLYSFSNPALQHVTALQIDSSGNVWVANNWSLKTTPQQIIGGDGVVRFIGVAAPVATPLIGQPVNPKSQN